MNVPWTERRETALRWLFWIQGLSMGAMDMSGPFWPMHLRDLGGLSDAEVAQASSLAYAGPLFMAMGFPPAWGHLADRLGHKPMVLRALVALALTQAWIAGADSVVSVLAARMVQGALAGFIAAAQAYGTRLCDVDGRGRLIARLQVATAIGSVAGPFLGGLLFEHVGFRAVNLLAAALCAACAWAAWQALPAVPLSTPPARGQTGSTSASPAWRLPAVLGLLLGIVAVQAARMMPQALFGLYAEQVLAVPPWVTGLCYGATALGLCVSAPAWGRRFDRLARSRVLGEAAGVALLCGCLAMVQLPGVPLPLLVAARFAWGLGLGALLPVFYTLLSRDAPEHLQGRAMGWGNAAAKAGALVGAVLMGTALSQLPLERLMWPVALAYTVAALWLVVLRRRTLVAARSRADTPTVESDGPATGAAPGPVR